MGSRHKLAENDRLNAVAVKERINTHTHGREYHNRVGKIGLEIGLQYSYTNAVIGKLFGENILTAKKRWRFRRVICMLS